MISGGVDQELIRFWGNYFDQTTILNLQANLAISPISSTTRIVRQLNLLESCVREIVHWSEVSSSKFAVFGEKLDKHM